MSFMKSLTEAGLTPQDLLVFAGATIIALFLVIFTFLSGAKQAKQRLKRVSRATHAVAADPASMVNVRRATADSSIAAIDYVIKNWLPNPQKLRAKLTRTGRNITLGQFMFACCFVGVLVGAALTMFTSLPAAACIFIGIAKGIAVPNLVVSILGSRRQAKFVHNFPEAIDLIVRGLKSGLPVSESIRVVGAEVDDPIGVEFRTITDMVKFGRPMIEAMWAVEPRIGVPEFRFFITSLSIQQETGGNLAETLDNLARVLRGRKQLKLKIKALSSEAKASAYIIGSLPFVMFGILMMMNPGYASQLYTDDRGLYMIAAGFTSYSIGIGVMWKMVRFDV